VVKRQRRETHHSRPSSSKSKNAWSNTSISHITSLNAQEQTYRFNHRVNANSFSVDKKKQLMSLFVFFISLLIVAQHVSGNHVPIIRS